MTSRDILDFALYLLPVLFIVLLVIGWRQTWKFTKLGKYRDAFAASLIQTAVFTLCAFGVLTRNVFGLMTIAFLFIGPVLLDWLLVRSLLTQKKVLLAFLVSLLPICLLLVFFVLDIWTAQQLLSCSCASPGSTLLKEDGTQCTFDPGTCMWGTAGTKMQIFYYGVISVIAFVVTGFVTIRKYQSFRENTMTT